MTPGLHLEQGRVWLTRDRYRERGNGSLDELTGFYQIESSEPKSHNLERHFTVMSLADLDLAGLDPSTY